MATYHPPGLPNETPGKASNTRWAAQRLWAFMEKEGLPEERVILTVADADSDFHAVMALFCSWCCWEDKFLGYCALPQPSFKLILYVTSFLSCFWCLNHDRPFFTPAPFAMPFARVSSILPCV